MSNEAGGMDGNQKRPFRWGPLLLGVSLALNLAVVGLVGGALLDHARDRRAPPPQSGEFLNYGPYTMALSDEDRRTLRRRLIGEAGVLRENRREVRRDFDRLLETLRADPYDGEATRMVLEEQQARVQKQVDLVKMVLVEHLEGMSAADRAVFADRLESVLRRGPRDRFRERFRE